MKKESQLYRFFKWLLLKIGVITKQEISKSDMCKNAQSVCNKKCETCLWNVDGEPLAPENRDEVATLCEIFKRNYPTKDIWTYTGYNWEDIYNTAAIKYADVIVDGKFVDALKDIRLNFRGSGNQNIINTKEKKHG